MQNTALLKQKTTQFKLSKITLQSLSKFSISPAGKLVLLYLVDCYNPYKAYMFPRQETISEKLGVSLSSVKRAVKELAKANIIIVELKFSNRYNLTQTFFDLLNMTPEGVQNEVPKCQIEPDHVLTEKEQEKEKGKDFCLREILELGRKNTVEYYREISTLSEVDKEHLCKIKLGRMALTDFQKVNAEKFIMLSESEIKVVNSKEPYFKQENIDIYYNARMKKIREATEERFDEVSKNERAEFLEMLKAGYKALGNNRGLLNAFLERNKAKMERFNIFEENLCTLQN